MATRAGPWRWWAAGLALGLLLLWFSDAACPQVNRALLASETILRGHPVLGVLVFSSLAAASALLAFFSSAVLVPSATAVWGKPTTLLLLWAGWIVGGALAYSIGRWLGRAVVHEVGARAAPRGVGRFLGQDARDQLAFYEERVGRRLRWWQLLLLQLALPSELPGYLAGILRVPFALYLTALAVGELPYALGSVYLGEAFAQRNVPAFVALLGGGALVAALLFGLLQRQLRRGRGEQVGSLWTRGGSRSPTTVRSEDHEALGAPRPLV